MIALTVDATRKGSIFISIKRGIAVDASVVCKVVRTKWPVKAALTEIAAVSSSLISPTKIMFGSCLKIDLNPFEKFKFAFGLTWIWLTPPILYSTGSSIVVIFFPLEFRILIIE